MKPALKYMVLNVTFPDLILHLCNLISFLVTKIIDLQQFLALPINVAMSFCTIRSSKNEGLFVKAQAQDNKADDRALEADDKAAGKRPIV